MFCKWCGLESETSDVCSWCNRPFSAAASAQQKPAEQTAAEENSQQAAPTVAPAVAQTPSKPLPPSKPGAVPLGDFDDLYDDFSPVPFANAPILSRPPAPAPYAPPARPSSVPESAPSEAKTPPTPVITAPPAQPISAPVVRAPEAAPASPPPVSPGRGGPGYTPAAPRQVEDMPHLEAIPIKRPGAPSGPPPAVIPIAKPAPQAPAPSVPDRPSPSTPPFIPPGGQQTSAPPPSVPDAPFIPHQAPPAYSPGPMNAVDAPAP